MALVVVCGDVFSCSTTFVILTFALVTEEFHWFITWSWMVFSLISLACVSARWIMCGDVREDADEDAVEDIPQST